MLYNFEIEQIYQCLTLLRKLHSNIFWYSDFVKLVPIKIRKKIIKEEAKFAVQSGAFPTENKFLQSLANNYKGIYSDESFTNKMGEILFCNVYDGGGFDEPLKLMINGIDKPLEDPSLCANLMSKKSYNDIFVKSILGSTNQLSKQYKNYKDIGTDSNDELTHDNNSILQQRKQG